MRLNLIIIFLLLVGMSVLSVAYIRKGTSPKPTEMAMRTTEWMRNTLALTEEQVLKVSQINLAFAKQFDDLRTGSMSRKERLTKEKANSNARDAELKQMLTSSQYQIYLSRKYELRKELKEEPGKGRLTTLN